MNALPHSIATPARPPSSKTPSDNPAVSAQVLSPWGDVFHAQWRRPLMIGIGLAVFQQITGINAIIYNADQIFASAGFTTHTSQTLVATWTIGGVNVLATFIAIAFIDRIGRRLLLLEQIQTLWTEAKT